MTHAPQNGRGTVGGGGGGNTHRVSAYTCHRRCAVTGGSGARAGRSPACISCRAKVVSSPSPSSSCCWSIAAAAGALTGAAAGALTKPGKCGYSGYSGYAGRGRCCWRVRDWATGQATGPRGHYTGPGQHYARARGDDWHTRRRKGDWLAGLRSTPTQRGRNFHIPAASTSAPLSADPDSRHHPPSAVSSDAPTLEHGPRSRQQSNQLRRAAASSSRPRARSSPLCRP